MKKIISTVLLLLAIMYPINMIKANEPITQVTSETVSLIDKGRVAFSNVTFNMSNHMSTGYTTLVMGSSTTYTIDLNNILQYFDYYTAGNVSNLYLEFELEAVYTGYTEAEYQWLSSNANWDSTTNTLDLGATMPTGAVAEVWWNVIGQSGGAPSTASGGLRIRNINLVAEYTNSISVFTPITAWNELPSGNGNFNAYTSFDELAQGETLTEVDIVDNLNGTHNVYIDLEGVGQYVASNITLPIEVRDNSSLMVIYLATADYKFLWFFETLDASNPYVNSDYLLWNLTLNEYQRVQSGTIYGMPYATGNGISTYNLLFTDLVIPYEMDQIISIRMQYEYRYHYVTMNYGQWIDTQKTLYKNAYTNTVYPWWIKWSGLLGFKLAETSYNFEWMDYNQIKDVTDEYNISKKQTMVSYLNANTDNEVEYTISNVFDGDYTVAQVFLGQYDRFGSNGVEAKDIVIMSIRYLYNGIEYSTIHPDTVIPDMPPEYPNDPVGNPWDDLLTELGKLWGPAYWIIVFVIAYSVAKVLLKKSPESGFKLLFRYAVIMGAIVIIVYLSYKPPTMG